MFLITEILIIYYKRSHSGSASDFSQADGTFSVINYAKHAGQKKITFR